MLAALLGPCEAYISMMAILLVQCILFADGGLMAYGCNVWNMAFYACFFGYLCIFRPIVGSKPTKKRIIAGSLIACVLSLQLGAFSVVLETLLSGAAKLPPLTFLMLMQLIHLSIGLVEGIITSCVLIFIGSVKPELISSEKQTEKTSLKKVIVIFAIITVFVGGGLSALASSKPDGLEWSVLNASEGEVIPEKQTVFDDIIDKTALLPDYNSDSFGSETFGTRFSGIVGSVVVGVFLAVCCVIFKLFKKGVVNDHTGKGNRGDK